MTAAPGFIFCRQEKPSNCSAVAIVNAARWAGCAASLERTEDVLSVLDPGPDDRGRDYRKAAPWLQVGVGVDVLLSAHDESMVLGPYIDRTLAGWAVVADIASPWCPGHRHAVVLAHHEEGGALVLDGKATGPERWPISRIREAGPRHLMMLRRPRVEV